MLGTWNEFCFLQTDWFNLVSKREYCNKLKKIKYYWIMYKFYIVPLHDSRSYLKNDD